MARFIESWGLRGSVSFFPLHLPLHSSFHGCALSPTFGQKLDRNVLLACILYSRRLLRSLFGPLHVSGKLPTYPSPKPTSTLTSLLGQKCWLRGGVGRNIKNCPAGTGHLLQPRPQVDFSWLWRWAPRFQSQGKATWGRGCTCYADHEPTITDRGREARGYSTNIWV